MSIVSAKEIPFKLELADSCNCECCFPPPTETVIYINHQYQVEFFDHKKSLSPKDDMKKTSERIKDCTKHFFESLPSKLFEKEEFTLADIHFINDYIDNSCKLKAAK